MSHTITFKLQKHAHQFQAGDSTGFGIRGGVKYYDRETKKDEWTSYEAVIFAKAQAQIDYYASMFVEGAVVTVSGKTQKIKQFTGQNGVILTIVLNDAYLEFALAPVQRAPDAARQAYQRAAAPAQNQPADDFDLEDSIPF